MTIARTVVLLAFLAAGRTLGELPAQTPTKAPAEPAWGEPAAGLQAGLVASVAEAEDASGLQILAVLRNAGEKEIEYNSRRIHPVLVLEVRDAAGKRMPTVPPPLPDKPDVAKWHMVRLKPGAKAEYHLSMGIFSPPLPPGTYTVRFALDNARSGAVTVQVRHAASAPEVAAASPDDQGVRGQVVKMTGDFMPGPGPSRGRRTPLAVPVYVFKGRIRPMAKPPREHPALLKVLQADKEGRFELALPPGEYTVVAEIDGALYLNLISGPGEWGSVKVNAGKWTDFTIEDTRGAAF
jgi:hypothetical protein